MPYEKKERLEALANWRLYFRQALIDLEEDLDTLVFDDLLFGDDWPLNIYRDMNQLHDTLWDTYKRARDGVNND